MIDNGIVAKVGRVTFQSQIEGWRMEWGTNSLESIFLAQIYMEEKESIADQSGRKLCLGRKSFYSVIIGVE